MDSILAQTYANFIVFAVDDGSTDGCGEILDEYAQKDRRIVVIHQKNRGIGAARNTGLEVLERSADFEFVAFVDSDDRVSNRYLETLVSEAVATQADIVICGLNRFDESGILPSREIAYPKKQLSKEMFVSLVFSVKEGKNKIGSGGYSFKQLFRASVVKGIRFPVGKLVEDEYYCVSSIRNATIIRYLPDKLIDYRQRADSFVHTPGVDEKLAIGRRLCIPIAAKISEYAGEIATAAYITAVINNYKNSGISEEIPKNILSSALAAKNKGLITAKTYYRAKCLYCHPNLAKGLFRLRKLFRKSLRFL